MSDCGREVFDSLMDYLDAVKSSSDRELITIAEFEEWQKQYTLDGLKGLRYGQSFCNHFGITDNILYYSLTPEQADTYIKEHYLERT